MESKVNSFKINNIYDDDSNLNSLNKSRAIGKIENSVDRQDYYDTEYSRKNENENLQSICDINDYNIKARNINEINYSTQRVKFISDYTLNDNNKYLHEEKEILSNSTLNVPITREDCFSQLKFISFYQSLFAEIIGTFILVLYVCSYGLPINDPSHENVTLSINGCLGAGFVVATLCHSIGHANLNPAVSIALLVTGDSNILRVLFYIPCQLLGSTLAVFTLRNLLPNHLTNQQFVIKQNITSENYIELSSTNNKITAFSKTIGLTLLNKDISPIQGFTIEFILTYILVLCIYACIDTRRKDLNGSFPLSIGFSVVVGALIGGPLTGGSMNPARSFGPALVMRNWNNHYIYWIGPITGAILAAFTYKLLLFKRK